MKFELFGEHTTPKYREYSEDIYTSGSILLALVSDLLDVSKIEVGGMELTESEVSLRLVVADCDRMFEHKVKNTGPELLFHVPEDIPLIRADSLRVRQIMVNLISNAIKFTPAGGRISVHAELSDDGTVVVVVNDTGIGIAVDELKSISEPFVRAGNLMDGRAEGSGLGLYLVKSLMEMHDGTLEIESTLGVGTTVTLTFPAARVVQAS